jgi:predicted ATPase/DNA-binding SARP family transcriptional activator
MEYRVLGPLEVLDESGQKVSLGGAMQQSVLASLLLRAGQTVALDRLVDVLWEEPPETAAKTVQVYVSRLRHQLPQGAIASRAGGYALLLNGGRLDLRAFEEAADKGRFALASGAYDDAARLLRTALEFWRGPALAGLPSDALRREGDRLEELRLQVLEDLLEADLGRGRQREIVSELQALVAEQPFRERPRAQLMLALYRSGRPGDALELYRQTRRLLVEELGMEPGQELRKLEQAILRGDPALDLPRAEAQTNLRLPLTPLIGREHELSKVLELLRANRVVTLTGPGGVGKTRLALQVALEVVAYFPDGVWFVSLAALRDPDLVLSTVAQTLGKEPQTLEQHLRGRQVLLVLDNFEQLLDAAPSLSFLIGEAPRTKLLVTSRTPLHVSGEHEYPVMPLAEEAAVRLFIERAVAVQPSFSPDEYLQPICRRLDNLPLAIELASARVKVLTNKALLARLEPRLPLLIGGPRDVSEKHQTLRATIEWSYNLLTPDERTLFARLAVFAGGCTLEAAEKVVGADVDTLQSLVEESLLHLAGERFFMLETIREFGLEVLDEAGDAADVRRRHARFFVQLLRPREDPYALATIGGPVFGLGDRRIRELIAPEVDNVRAAVEWALATEDFELALQLVYASVAVPRISPREATHWYDRALAQADSVSPPAAADAYRVAAFMNFLIGQIPEAHELGERSLTLYRRLDNRAGEATALRILGTVAALEGQTVQAHRCFERALAIADEHGLDHVRYAVMHELGEFERELGHAARSAELLEKSIELARAAGNLGVAAAALHGLGDLLLDERDFDAADARYVDALALGRDLMFEFAVMNALGGLAATAAKRGDARRAGRLWGAALSIETEHESPLGVRARVRYERALAAVAGRRFEAAVAAGEAADLNTVVEDALGNRV